MLAILAKLHSYYSIGKYYCYTFYTKIAVNIIKTGQKHTVVHSINYQPVSIKSIFNLLRAMLYNCLAIIPNTCKMPKLNTPCVILLLTRICKKLDNKLNLIQAM